MPSCAGRRSPSSGRASLRGPTLPKHGSRASSPTQPTSASRPSTSRRWRRDAGSTDYGRRCSSGGPYTGGQLVVGVPVGLDGLHPGPLGRRRARRDRRCSRRRLPDGLVAGAGQLPSLCARSRPRPRPSPGASSPSGFQAKMHARRSGVWPGPSTPCSDASRGPSPNEMPPNRSCGRRRFGCGNSWQTLHTSCAPR